MPTNNLLVKYLAEFIMRFGQKTPKFFRILSIVATVAAALTGLPGLLDYLGVNLPEWASVLQNKIVGVSTTTVALLSMLSVDTKPIAETESGEIIKKSNEEALPFTAAVEKKETSGMLPPAEVIK